MYADLSWQGHIITRYGDNMMKVTREAFRKWVKRLQENVVYKNNEENDVWIIPAIGPTCFINDGKSLPGYATADLERVRCVLKYNDEVFEMLSPDCASDFYPNPVLRIRTFHNINIEEKFFWEYISSYNFSSWAKLKSSPRFSVVIATGSILERCTWYMKDGG